MDQIDERNAPKVEAGHENIPRQFEHGAVAEIRCGNGPKLRNVQSTLGGRRRLYFVNPERRTVDRQHENTLPEGAII